MKKIYNITYNDGVEYGQIKFTNKTESEIENEIQKEIRKNNKTSNKDYHIARENFIRTQ